MKTRIDKTKISPGAFRTTPGSYAPGMLKKTQAELVACACQKRNVNPPLPHHRMVFVALPEVGEGEGGLTGCFAESGKRWNAAMFALGRVRSHISLGA